MRRRFVRRVVENIPAAEDQIVQTGQRNKILDHRAAALGAFPEADGSKLCERTNGLAEAALYRFNPRHERGADRSNAGNQDPQLAFRGRNPGISYSGQLRISLSGTRMLKCTLEQGCRRLSAVYSNIVVTKRVNCAPYWPEKCCG